MTGRKSRAAQLAKRVDRKGDILVAAERLFAQSGFSAVSIRQIAVEAKVPLALVGYYFGQKHELFQAIFAHWSPTIDERLAALYKVKIVPQDPQTLVRIVDAFVDPVLRMRASSEGEYYALLVARELLHATEPIDIVLKTYFDPMAHAFIEALNLAMPHATRGEVAWCYQFALGALLHHMSDVRIERLSLQQNKAVDPSARPLLVNFIVGGIRATLSLPEFRRKPSTTRRLK